MTLPINTTPVSMAEYRDINAVNHSRLRRLAESPWHYQNPSAPKKPSAEFIFGTQFHALLLEPAEFAKCYEQVPALNKNSKDWKLLMAELADQGKEPIDVENFMRLENMREAVLSDPYVSSLFKSGKAEQTLLFSDPVTGLACKARLDWIPDDFDDVLVDLKTTRSGNPDSLRKSCWDYGYHTQAAFYSMAWEVITGQQPQAFLFVFVEKPDDPQDTPLPPQLYQLDDPYQEAGKRQVRDWLNLLDVCIRQYGDNPWPNYTQGLTKLSAPAWAKLGD